MTQTQIRRRTFQYKLYIFHDWWPVMSSPVTHSTTTRPDDDKLLINLPRTSNLFQIYKCDRWPGTHRVHTGATDWVFRRHLIHPPSRCLWESSFELPTGSITLAACSRQSQGTKFQRTFWGRDGEETAAGCIEKSEYPSEPLQHRWIMLTHCFSHYSEFIQTLCLE